MTCIPPPPPRRPTAAALAALLLLPVFPSTAAPRWHETLSYGDGGVWTVRVPVEITNPAAGPLQAAPVMVTLAGDDGTKALIGLPAASLRVVPAAGPEVLFGLQDANGREKRVGPLAAGDRVGIPADVPAGAKASYYLYAGNPRAWLPPEWLQADIVNPGFESGGIAPTGWRIAETDAKHRMSRQPGDAHTGAACARCDVAADAEPSWVKYYQRDIPLIPNGRYRFTAWVKGENVRGRAGWYLHVRGESDLLINTMAGHEGTFDWREVTIAFTAPATARSLSFGTVLRGTGTAWYDDVRLEAEGKDAATTTVGPAERLDLRAQGRKAPWNGDPGRWPWRVPIDVRNATDEDIAGAMVAVDARRINNHAAKLLGFGRRPALRVTDGAGAPLLLSRLARRQMHVQKDLLAQSTFSALEELFVLADVPKRTERRLWLYLGPPADAGGRPDEPSLAAWAGARANLLRNGDMEAGDGEKPDAWTGGPKPGITARRAEGGLKGSRCLELIVPKDLKHVGWIGWHQRVAVKPGTPYTLAGHIRTQAVEGGVRIHGHFLRADGKHTARPFFSTAPALTGTQDWTATTTTVTTPHDCAFINVHLTANTRGTIRHDAVVLAEAGRAEAGPLEAAKPVPGLSAWAVNASVKTFPDDIPPPRPARALVVHAARNEGECAQLALRSPESLDVTVAASPLTGPGGTTIAAPAVHRTHYVPVDFPVGYDSSTAPPHVRLVPRRRGTDGWRGEWPDALVPVDGKLALAADRTESLWLDVRVPRDAVPGTYEGTLTLAAGATPLRVPVRLTVWNFTQPDAKHLPALYDLRRGPGGDFVSGVDRNAGIRRWYRFLADHHVSPSFLLPRPSFRYRDGTVTMDATAADRMAAFLLDELKCPAVYTPRIFYAAGWARLPKSIYGLKYGTPEYDRAWTETYRLFIEHMTKKGWRKRIVFYLSDEPHAHSRETIEGLAHVADLARKVAPDVPVYSSTWTYIAGLEGHVSLWGIGPHGSFREDKLAERRRAGDRFWFTTDGHMCTDTPFLAVERLLPWLCLKYDVGAYEFWGVSWWTHNPWEKGWHAYIRQSADGRTYRSVRYPNGDGFLAYPGGRVGVDGPVPTIRLLAARDGVEDYELFRALKRRAAAGRAGAKEALDGAMALVSMRNRGGRYSTTLMPDPDAVRAARIRAGEALSAAVDPGR